MICACVPNSTLVNIILSAAIRMQHIALNAEASRSTLRLIDFFTIPKHNGDSVILLLSHPGVNTLGRYFSPSKVNDLLLTKQTPPPQPDVYKIGMVPELEDKDQSSAEDLSVMDLTTFMESVFIATIASPMFLMFLLDLLYKPPTAWT